MVCDPTERWPATSKDSSPSATAWMDPEVFCGERGQRKANSA